VLRNALIVAAIAEAATGLALLIVPSLVGELLLGEALAGAAATVARVAGLALIGLGLACWPGPPRLGMLTYGAAVALYLAWVGISGASAGVLLWPAVVLHLVLSASIARSWRQAKALP
jgi:hypothetical protein